jgi:hypothetical protein
MRFRSELLQPQPPSNDPEATLTEIYDVYRSPDGHIAGDEDNEEDANREGHEPWTQRR